MTVGGGAAAPVTGAIEIRLSVAERDVVLDLALPAGEVVALIGPNGAGKSTLLSAIAGLVRPDDGRIVLDGTPLVDVPGRIFVPPHQRGVSMLAQQAMLFPHLTAAENVAFGPRSRGVGRRQAAVTAHRWLTEVDAIVLADRKPARLSGGQAQRIAVARALAVEPALLLLDEPMAALDVAAAPAMRQLLRQVLRTGRRTAVLVTHDIVDALALADRLIVLDGGRVVEDGDTRAVLSRPRSSFAARLAEVNLVPGCATTRGLDAVGGEHLFGLLDPLTVAGEPAVALFAPSAVAVHLTTPTGSPRNHLQVTVAEMEPRGAVVRVRSAERADGLPAIAADLTAGALADLDLVPGRMVFFAVKATEVAVHPRAVSTH